METTEQPRQVEQVVDGWAAYSDRWAVHAPTKEEVLRVFKERAEYRKELSKRAAELQSQWDAENAE